MTDLEKKLKNIGDSGFAAFLKLNALNNTDRTKVLELFCGFCHSFLYDDNGRYHVCWCKDSAGDDL